jgi:hypothetical protein
MTRLDDPYSNFIDDALSQLHAAGWSIGDTALYDVEHGGLVRVVLGSNGENPLPQHAPILPRRENPSQAGFAR